MVHRTLHIRTKLTYLHCVVQIGGLVYDLFSSAHLPIICYLTALLERRRKLQGGVRPGSPARILQSPWIPKPTSQRQKALSTHDAVVSTSDSRKTIQTIALTGWGRFSRGKRKCTSKRKGKRNRSDSTQSFPATPSGPYYLESYQLRTGHI